MNDYISSLRQVLNELNKNERSTNELIANMEKNEEKMKEEIEILKHNITKLTPIQLVMAPIKSGHVLRIS